MPVLGGVRGVALFITLMNRLCSNFTWLHSMLSKDLHLEYAPKTFIKEVHRKKIVDIYYVFLVLMRYAQN